MKNKPPFLLQVFVSAVMFLGGGWLSIILATRLSDSLLVSITGFFMLPVAFMASIGAFGLLNFMTRAGRALRKRSLTAGDEISDTFGALIVIPVSVIIGVIGGLIIGFAADTITPTQAALRFGFICLNYGFILWVLIRLDLIAYPD